MYYYLTFEGINTERRYTFKVETQSNKGWVKLRMVAIEEVKQHEKYKEYTFTEYNPEIHNEKNNKFHYMTELWTARRCWDNNQQKYTYYIVIGKGIIFHKYIQIASDTIVRFT